ncbi:hypothetical protein MKEN_01400200 [Mycena kentingensis (nom. inval.)]|nr:hypothetical protein MKEN_01400200 [Mycena kentingensis (nom. inval.)]
MYCVVERVFLHLSVLKSSSYRTETGFNFRTAVELARNMMRKMRVPPCFCTMTTTPPTSEPLPSPHRSPRQRPGSMKDTWLETILESSRADAAAVEEAMKTARPDAAIAGLPSAAKNMFHHVILMLETAQKTKSYKSDLKELCMTVDQCCTTISGLCTNQQPTRTEPRICVDLCKEFAGLLEQLRITVSKLETKVQSPVGRMKAHLHLGKTTSKITEHEKQLNTFSERLQPVADLDRVFMLKTDLVSLSAVVDSNEVPTSARIFGDANFAQNSISNSTVINVPFSGAGNVVSSLNIMVPAQEHSEVLKIFNCPQPIRFFCGRTDILGKMTSYFDSGMLHQNLLRSGS